MILSFLDYIKCAMQAIMQILRVGPGEFLLNLNDRFVVDLANLLIIEQSFRLDLDQYQ
jgi:hypothetical protein